MVQADIDMASSLSSGKSVQLDFFKKGPAGENTRYIVSKHTLKLIPIIL